MSSSDSEELASCHNNGHLVSNETDNQELSFFSYLQCFFISVATILGTGILGLPLMLENCGIYPFLLTFVISYFMQMLAVYFFVELLQICDSALKDFSPDRLTYSSIGSGRLRQDNCDPSIQPVQLESSTVTSLTADESNKLEADDVSEVAEDDRERLISSETAETDLTPNLHILGKLFLNRWLCYGFYLLLLLHFITILTSYALAGSEAYGQLFHVSYVYIIPVFVWVLVVIIIFGFHVLQPVISTMTLAKGSIFVVTILVGIYVGTDIGSPIINSWKAIREPLLMEVVALGGLPQVMPMMYSKFGKRKSHIKGFRAAIFAALTFCMILNVMWSWTVLSVVPQFDPTCRHPSLLTSSVNLTTTTTSQPHDVIACDPARSIEAARMNGLISTVPLTQVLLDKRPQLTWIAILLRLFVIISVTVSFLTIGAALQHTVIGFVDYVVRTRRLGRSNLIRLRSTSCCCYPPNFLWHVACGFLAFVVVFAVAASNPKSFVKLLDKVASFGLNMTTGPVIFAMHARARSPPFRHLTTPLTPEPALRPARFLLLIFFGGAVVYEIVDSVVELAIT